MRDNRGERQVVVTKLRMMVEEGVDRYHFISAQATSVLDHVSKLTRPDKATTLVKCRIESRVRANTLVARAREGVGALVGEWASCADPTHLRPQDQSERDRDPICAYLLGAS